MSCAPNKEESAVPQTINNWQEFLAESKKKFEENLCVEPEMTACLSDFDLIQTVGEGTFGTVVLAKHFSDEQYYAIKILDKARLVQTGQVKQTLNEKRILMAVDFVFIIRIKFFFKDNSYIYFVLPFINGGEMFFTLRRIGRFTETLAIFYATQVVLGFEYLHNLDIIYRDLKPENVLIDSTGYLKITDLGFCKIVTKRTYTLCGTPDYIAPEVILSRGYSHAVDWWSLGVFIFEMVAGYPPFYSHDTMKTYKLITSARYKMIPTFSSPLKDLLTKLLQVDVTKRYGSLKGGANDIKNHSWFRPFSWMEVLKRAVKPPFIPSIRSPGDASNFQEFSDKRLHVSPVERYKEHFEDF